MLSKLIKYDTKKMSKILVYIYAITLGLACITRLINIGKDIQIISIIGSVFAGLTYSAMFNIIVNMFVHILKVFISSLSASVFHNIIKKTNINNWLKTIKCFVIFSLSKYFW